MISTTGMNWLIAEKFPFRGDSLLHLLPGETDTMNMACDIFGNQFLQQAAL